MRIEFSIKRAELLEVLKFLAPFIVPQRKDEDDEDETDEITLPAPYF